MKVREIMSANPACCSPASTVEDVAGLMAEHDCGEIPVVDSQRRPLGVITDRDIACRAVSKGKGPGTSVQDAMSAPAITVSPEMSVEECCRIMESNQIRRVPVVDAQGGCCGMVAQADLARRGPGKMTAELVRDVSQPPPQAR
jgi:CBS domain-containing protein